MRVYTNYLMHHGVKGMRWGVKRMLQKKKNGQRLMNVGKNLVLSGFNAASLSGIGLLAGMHYGDKQFETEGNIYARVKKSTRV